MVKSVFGENLTRLRKQKGFSRKQLADELHINETTLAGYENIGREPKYSVLVTIADYFNVSADELLTGKKNRDSAILNYRFSYNLNIAEQLGIKLVSENETMIMFSIPMAEQFKELPQKDGKIKILDSVQWVFANRETFCGEFEKWISAAVSQEKTLLEIVSEIVKDEHLKNLNSDNSAGDSI